MEQLGYFGILLLMFLDNVFPPIPSEIIMPSAGFSASQGQLTLYGVILAGSSGSLIAAALLYWIGYQFSHDSIFKYVDRYGKYIFIQQKDIQKALVFFEKYGHRIVFFGRMIPAVRSLISIPAGMSRMPFWKFMFYSALGTIIWTTFLACIGYYFGQNKILMDKIISHLSLVIITLAVIFIICYLYRKFKNKSR
ncbi:Inner membrane protein YqjA [Acinetobacter stercoris]|uniref:Inner membrane protein YqjA n=2 Tax=Acinetobacter stercoris TaxID=2126983 RepID=A0A2U3MVB6_9GAMM|nr:Inner membrane protein YqjA [Acinetobacter stercoris]